MKLEMIIIDRSDETFTVNTVTGDYSRKAGIIDMLIEFYQAEDSHETKMYYVDRLSKCRGGWVVHEGETITLIKKAC